MNLKMKSALIPEVSFFKMGRRAEKVPRPNKYSIRSIRFFLTLGQIIMLKLSRIRAPPKPGGTPKRGLKIMRPHHLSRTLVGLARVK